MQIHIFAAAALLALSACNQSGAEDHKHNHSTTEEATTLQLNHGARWQVNAEMYPHLSEIEAVLAAYPASADQDADALAGEIKKNIERLTASCTMQGEAHEELHKWLHPFIQNVNTLSKTRDPEEAAEQYRRLKVDLETFHQYFE